MNARGVTFEAQRKANEKADVSEHTTAQGVVVKITGVSWNMHALSVPLLCSCIHPPLCILLYV